MPRAATAAVRIGLLLSMLSTPAMLRAQDPAADLKRRVDQLRATGVLQVGGETITMSQELAALYEEYDFQPLWLRPGARADLLRVIRDAGRDGLVPAHYHLPVLELAEAAPAVGSAALDAEIELLRSHGFLHLLNDLRHGRLRGSQPATAEPAAAQDTARAAPGVAAVHRAITDGRLDDVVKAARPAHFIYEGLVEALAGLRELQAAGGWPAIADGPALRLDSSDARVPQLRRRLALSGDLPAAHADDGSIAFDSLLHHAVMRVQHRHGLNEDGVVGARTLTELNVPVETRIDQVRINLERGRWLLHDLADTFVAVNVAGAMVYLVRAGDVVHEARAIVGRTYTATPVFTATMQYIDVNPTWTVPPGIVGEVLSAIRRDPGYLRAQNITVLDRAGRVVPASSIDFGRYSARTFPYAFRQEPGPQNPLGVIKFMFPNRHNVYLHDTPARALFEQEDRLFSHGCIRISDPLRLAELLLAGTTWDRPALEAAVSARGTRTIRLPRPVPVLIQYWTASTDLHRELHFYRDVYGRDAAVLRGLDRR